MRPLRSVALVLGITLALASCSYADIVNWHWDHGHGAQTLTGKATPRHGHSRGAMAQQQAWINEVIRVVKAWEQEQLRNCRPGNPAACETLTRQVFGSEGAYAVRVFRCESGMNPHAGAANGYRFLGLSQQHAGYWPSRAARAGWAGADWRNPRANLEVALMLRRESGWGHWPVCRYR